MNSDQVGILVLCTGNSCRSQIAAAYLEKLGGDRLAVYSAGTEPANDIHPLTRVVLAEDGIDIGDRTPADYRDYLGRISVYYLAIVCDGAAKSCPSVWPGVMERLLWPFEDPAAFEGSHDEKLVRFRRVRDQIKDKVETWVSERETILRTTEVP
jgi:arsenate reductase